MPKRNKNKGGSFTGSQKTPSFLRHDKEKSSIKVDLGGKRKKTGEREIDMKTTIKLTDKEFD